MLKQWKKRLMSLFAAGVFVLGGGAPALREAGVKIDLPAFAAEIVDSGTCGENVTWTLDSEGTLTISGTGEMNNYNNGVSEHSPWYQNEKVNKVTIENGVTSIGIYAFYYCRNLTSIDIPDSVTSINERAFYNCRNLKSISIPYSITNIDSLVFYGCSSLTSITIPDSVTSISNAAFSGCSSLSNITIPNSVMSIGDSAFGNCSSLTSITIPNSITSISNSAFWGCSNLSNVTIPNTVTSIGNSTFCYCYNLSSITIPNSVTSIGSGAFKDCRSLTSITIPNTVTSISGRTFSGCSSLSSVTIPNSVTSIGEYAFSECKSLTCITIPDSVTSIGHRVFEFCSSLTSLTLPEGITSINSSSFYKCSMLQSITIPDSVTSIGASAFYSCWNLANINIPNSVTSIGDYAFYDCRSLTSITIPNSVSKISPCMFLSCQNLSSITIPNSVTSIGESSFSGCTSLTNITIPNSVASIGKNTFLNCKNLKSIVIPKSVTSIGAKAFGYHHYIAEWESYEGFKIYCYKDSAGEKYAKDNCLEYDLIDGPAADKYIINEVTKYCTDVNDDFNKRVRAVLNSGADWSVIQNELLKILSDKGINDIHEGLDYLRNNNEELSNALPYRMNYQYLTSNEVFCASQFDKWIMSDEAIAQRAALYSSGLIFNNEFFGSINFSTDLIEHYPEAKKNKEMLRDFLESTDKGFDVYSNAETTGKYINSALKVLGTDELQRANVADLQKKMFSCTDDVEWKKLQKSYTAALAGDNIDKNGKVLVNVKSISKALGKSTSALSFASATTDDIIKMINLENEVALYQENIKFLQTIANSESATYAMRVAANSLLEDISLQYYRLTENILRRTFNFTLEIVDFDVWKEIFGDVTGETIGNVLGTYKLAVFFSNMVIDTGDFVKQTSYTQGYAQLSAIYADILKKDKERFNSNKTADNAWQFFEDYTILWQLRYKGEEQYEKAQHVKSFFKLVDNVNISYFYKLPVIEANLLRLNDAKFTVSSDIVIPTSVKYMKKAVIHCPVDVFVYNSAGSLIATLKDGAESDITNSYGRFAVVYDPVLDEYEKVICQTTGEELKLKILAVDSGLVDYDFAYLDSGNKIKIQSFDNEALNKGDAINISASKNTNKYEIDLNDDGTIDSSKTLSQNNGEYIKVDSISVEKSDFSLSTGDTEVITVKIHPANATYTLLNWLSRDSSIVEVDNGKLTAKSPGSTEIYVQSADNPSACLTIKVSVGEKTNTVCSVVPKFDGKETRTYTDITLSVGGKTFTANSTGKITITGLANGTYEAVVSKPNYAPVNVTITVGGENADVTIYKYGDVDKNGKVDQSDLALLQKHSAGWNVTVDKPIADVTLDGKVGGEDIALMQKYFAGWNVTLGKAS